jgi:hypothetical protein
LLPVTLCTSPTSFCPLAAVNETRFSAGLRGAFDAICLRGSDLHFALRTLPLPSVFVDESGLLWQFPFRVKIAAADIPKEHVVKVGNLVSCSLAPLNIWFAQFKLRRVGRELLGASVVLVRPLLQILKLCQLRTHERQPLGCGDHGLDGLFIRGRHLTQSALKRHLGHTAVWLPDQESVDDVAPCLGVVGGFFPVRDATEDGFAVFVHVLYQLARPRISDHVP